MQEETGSPHAARRAATAATEGNLERRSRNRESWRLGNSYLVHPGRDRREDRYHRRRFAHWFSERFARCLHHLSPHRNRPRRLYGRNRPPHCGRTSAAAPDLTEEQLFASSTKDIYFDYDRYDLRAEDQATINANAAFLKAHPSMRFTIEGHCDERGSTDYNIALGDNRANAARSALITAGVAASQIRVISYGKEKPFCTESNETCWQQNRRDHFVYGQK